MISVLMLFRHYRKISANTAALLSSPTLSAVFAYLFGTFSMSAKKSCDKIHIFPLRRRNKSRYQNASLTVEASVAFPVFYFAVIYLLQMFCVLRAELVIGEAGLASAREAAAYSYAAERLADGENAVAETLLDIFDKKIVQDVTMTAMFHARCDKEILKQARVAQGYSGIWVDTEAVGETTRAEIYYWVKPANMLTEGRGRFYVMRLVFRNWTGEGGTKTNSSDDTNDKETVYMTEHGTVYHRKQTCSYIKIDVSAVRSEFVSEKRNSSGAKYYACEFCGPVLQKGTQVYITEYGTRYHGFSTCSAIARNVKECDLEEVKDIYPACSRCGERGGI